VSDHQLSDAELEFGRALCDRLGLDPNRVLRGYHIEPIGPGEALVTLEVMQVISKDDLRELQAAARARAAAAALAALTKNTFGGTE
jgi:hypothetical protein